MYYLLRVDSSAIRVLFALALLIASRQPAAAQSAAGDAPDDSARPTDTYDIVIYGGTSAGIAAAVQAARMNSSVVVVEPTHRIGGLTTGGLGQTDIGNKSAIGGISREFYQRVRKYYLDDENWKWQPASDYRSRGQSITSDAEDTMWTFEPSAALKVMQDLVGEHGVSVVYGERLDRTPLAARGGRVRGVEMDGSRITAIRCESGKTFRGKVFIDATYEGDLMAGAGVRYIVGRENLYDESLNGVQTARAIHHQLLPGIDPYVIAGDASSGLLFGIDPQGPGAEGQADHRVQAYCFRMCLTDHPDNRIPFSKPADYDPLDYELLFRNFEAGAKVIPWANSAMPNRKTDINNNRGFSTDYIGQNYAYPDASYAERERIVERHRVYQQGLMWTLANHPRVPEFVRQEVSRWGTCRDEFEREDGWQQQLYIREARRMIGDYVMTQHDCQGRLVAERPIGLAAYTMDSHHVQRYITADGHVRNEGDVQVGGFSPYPIDYGSLLPKKSECTNLIVPVCLSASHMAFGSIRMEPVFMVLGQSSATAAVQAIAGKSAVQDVDYPALRDRLQADKQVLVWTGPKRTTASGIVPSSLPGIVVDDQQAERIGFESSSDSMGPFIGIGYRHDSDTAKGSQSVRFSVKVPADGRYEVRLGWSAHSNRATRVPVILHNAGSTQTAYVNERLKPNHGPMGTVGVFDLRSGPTTVEISNAGTDGYVIVDAVQILPQNSTPAVQKPNILLIVSDDQGYADAGFQGSTEIPTPNLDGLAASGIRCTNGYVSHPFCSPTRAGLLTGRYQQEFGHVFNPVYDPLDKTEGLPLSEKLIPQYMRDIGYVTGWTGKWHLGSAPAYTPQQRGFDETFGFIGGGHQFYNWSPNERQYTLPIERNGEPVTVDEHLTTRLGSEAAAFATRHAEQPWFLYVAFNAPHTPHQPTPERLAKFSHIQDEQRARYAAQISLLDDAIGNILGALDATQQRARTLVFFFSDNGGRVLSGASNDPLRGGKGETTEGGIRVPFLVSWPAELTAGTTYDKPVISLDVLATSLAAAGAELKCDQCDSVNLLPYLRGDSSGSPHERLYWRSGTGEKAAMRAGDWKLVRVEDQPDELFDLSRDIGEAHDLAASESGILQRLAKELDTWEQELPPPAFLGSSVKHEDWGPGGANQRQPQAASQNK